MFRRIFHFGRIHKVFHSRRQEAAGKREVRTRAFIKQKKNEDRIQPQWKVLSFLHGKYYHFMIVFIGKTKIEFISRNSIAFSHYFFDVEDISH